MPKKVFRLCLLLVLAAVVAVLMQVVPSRQQIALAPEQDSSTPAVIIEEERDPPVIIKPAPPQVHLPSAIVAPGDFFAIYIENTTLQDEIFYSSKINSRPFKFYPHGDGFAAFIPVSYTVKPGEYDINIKLFRDDWLMWEDDTSLTVIPKEFAKQYLKVTASQDAIRTSDKRFDDYAELARGRSVTSPAPLWQDAFLMPVQGRITTEWGLIRYVNNANPTRHSGLDIAAPAGTPIKATNNGRVTLAKSLYSPGNTVIIDHGLNLFSNHYHLDKIFVKEGDTVKKGDVIGTVGSTGFSTGPHLHWTITIGYVSVNPWQLLAINPLELLILPTE
jgi:murein DD-endopeptidase MepM/ murein hydrolase activator NlpD